VWSRYLCGAMIDDGYTGIIERNARLRARFYAADKIVMEQFQLRLANWVHSNIWDRRDAQEASARMNSLAYSHSTPNLDTLRGCEICEMNTTPTLHRIESLPTVR
jgi:hypothetical protein